MIVFPNCKINLGLHILQKRKDGFHDIETVFYPLAIHDGLEIIQSTSKKGVAFSTSGLVIDGPEETNLCIKAYHLLKVHFPHLPPVKMHLHKVIPMGAGLGGGSSNGAYTLLLLNQKFHLQSSDEQLIQYAAQLGSDCPFFIINKPCLATGKGEILLSLELNLSAYKFIIVNPGIHINTKWAFSQITPATNYNSLNQIIQLPINEWKNYLINDFEKPVFELHKELQNIKNTLYENGAVYAAMTGSGSTLFGMFYKEADPILTFPPSYFVQEVSA